ncbi:phospholipase D p2 [Cladorrhinum sp. PSN332]|nr:phospholipase D p2 [Cladorrhinum sp. PSN332]
MIFVAAKLKRMQSFKRRVNKRLVTVEIPHFDITDAPDRDLLLTHSIPHSFRLGTGSSIYTDALIPAITSARFEVILVTCFWAPSQTLTAIRDALTKLAAHRRAINDDARLKGTPTLPSLRVRICFSSRSLFQKLFHPQSRHGYVYPSSSWEKKLGLPNPSLLQAAAIHLEVKSLFFLPFSVMHPKFVIVDRRRAFIPSCNVSWEPWLEGCVEISGGAVAGLLSFYSRTWDVSSSELDLGQPLDQDGAPFEGRLVRITSTADSLVAFDNLPTPIQTLLLPSSSHRNPHLRPFPWQKHPEPPNTPLNVALLELLEGARQSIYMQTPNLTCEAVIKSLLEAVERGVDVTIVTGRNMMLLEQLVTAGTTTSWCVRSLLRRFRKLQAGLRGQMADLEVGRSSPQLGRLLVSYFRPRPRSQSIGRERQPLMTDGQEDPVHSHLKLTIVDHQFTVLGSGNMDRASWFTSQELGVLFHDQALATSIRTSVDGVLDGRLDVVFDSSAAGQE